MPSSSLGTWKRQDHTPLETRSDGYATGITMVALEQAGLAQNLPQAKRGLAWLAQNQNSDDGKWPAWSVNLKRDPASDIGRFMSDAATGFAVLALLAAYGLWLGLLRNLALFEVRIPPAALKPRFSPVRL